MSTRNLLQSPSLLKQASFVKEKVREGTTKLSSSLGIARKSSAPVGHEQYLLPKDQLTAMMDYVKNIILHLRARIKIEKEALMKKNASEEEIKKQLCIFGIPSDEAPSASKTLSDAQFIQTVAGTGLRNLHPSLMKFTIPSIAAVIKLIFQSADSPLLRADIVGEIAALQEQANKNKVALDIDDLRAVLGKASARNIDVLGQLVALLSVDSTGVQRLAYMWGIKVFFPRFDTKSAANKEYEGFDIPRLTPVVIQVTQMMIEQCTEVFGLDDDEYITRLAKELKEAELAQMKVTTQPRTQMPQQTPIVANAIKKVAPVAKTARKAQPIGMCRVLYTFEAEGKLEITVAEGEEVFILDRGTDEWWTVRTLDNREGLIPENYVEEIEWDGVVPVEEEIEEKATEEEPQETENNARTVQQKPIPRYSTEEAMEEEAPAEPEELDEQIVALQKQLEALQKRKTLKKRTSSQESVESTGGQQMRTSAVRQMTFDEAKPVKAVPPPKPSQANKMPPPAIPKKAEQSPTPVPASVNRAAENQRTTANPPALPVRVPKTVASPESPAHKAAVPPPVPQAHVRTPMPSKPSSVSASSKASSDGVRPQLDLNAVMAMRAARLSDKAA